MSAGSADDAVLAELADRILVIARELQTQTFPDDVTPLVGSEQNVIRFIDRNPGSSPSDVAIGTGLQRSNLSAALRALEARGFVERRPDPEDARRIQLWHTAAADANLAKLRAARVSMLTRALADDVTQPDAVDALRAFAFLDRLESGIARARRLPPVPAPPPPPPPLRN
jgi:DNA-binding MarR family transcriptional regulator